MKREAVTHTKMKRLCRRLDIPVWQAIGLLESIWLLTGREAPRGDIGKLADEDIALAIDYRGDESKLVEALISAGWIDHDKESRLIVHDWSEHAEDWVRARLVRARQSFADGRPAHPNYNKRILGSTKRSRRRDRMLSAGTPSKLLRAKIYTRDAWACQKCASVEDLTLDHIVPVSMGGITAEENLQTLCRRCNSSKRDHCLGSLQ